MQHLSYLSISLPIALVGIFLALAPPLAQAAAPDLTEAGVIAALKVTPGYSSSPYNETYNLGATGLRGWIYDGGGQSHAAVLGLTTDLSRQILITVASTPGSEVLTVDDVILGAMAGSTGTVPNFTSDSRKAIGAAISDAEKTGAGTLRVKRWRDGDITDVNIAMTVLGNYTATAPYDCPKSTQILANARTKLVAELLADPNFLSTTGYTYSGAIKGLALMAGVVPGDANYSTVQTRLQSFAQALTPENLKLYGCDTWNWAYVNIFLSEYYLRSVEADSPDAGVLAGINKYTVAMAKGQSRYGTFGHGGSALTADGNLHGTIPPYGPVNCAGIAANLSIVFGKKALLAGFQALDPEIDPAIERGSKFFKYYVNKGTIPYGEHEPAVDGHSFNGKEAISAMFFALQGDHPVETEYYSRLAAAGYMGREEGHSGTGFNYLWEAMGANVGGPTAVAKYLEKIRWNLDLERRTDGSFVYDGAQRKEGGGSTSDGTYLGLSEWQLINPTASYVLTYSLPLQCLYITGKNANPANTLDAAKVDNAIAAATYQLDCHAFSNTQLIADLSEFDPVVRNAAAIELGKRSLSTGEVDTLITMVDSAKANERMGACQALGILKIPAALPLLSQRLTDTDLWVRAKAAKALRSFSPEASSSQLTPMLNAFIANATDPEVIVWEDPIQIANNFLSFALFGDSVYNGNNIAPYTLNAPKNLLYPAVRAGLRQPDSNPRLGVSNFTYNLTLADAQALAPELLAVATTTALADTMWHGEARAAGIGVLAKFKAAEAIPLAVAMQKVVPGFGWGAHHYQISALNALSSFGDASRWTLPGLRTQALTLDTSSSVFETLTNTVVSIDAAVTSPAGINHLMAVANPQMVVTTGVKAITLTGSSCRGTAVTFSDVTAPVHGTLTGTAPNLIYTPLSNYIGPDFFTFKTRDALTTSTPSTVSIIVGAAGAGMKGEYFDNKDFTDLKLTRTDAEVNFDWGVGSPSAAVSADTFSARWSGQLLIPETGNYTFSTLNSDGVRLFVDGAPLIDDYVDQSTGWQDCVPISLTAGQKVELQMEYYENTGSAVAKLKWTGPSLAGLNGLPIAKEWLYDGTGIVTRTAYAHAQSVTLIQNSAQMITLTGSGAGQSPLTYSIIHSPANGTLSGNAPNLIYTPSADFSGSDSFTFTVNNGHSDSAQATVSIGIWAGQLTSYFWTNAVSGNWSDSFWTNAAGGLVTPAVAGNPTYSMNFNKSGTYTTTLDLNNNYLFNQLNVAGTVTFAGTNTLSPKANGSLLPQINQNSGSPVSFSTPINLASDTTFGGTGGGSMTISSLISGTGSLIKTSPGSLTIKNATNNYAGGTIITKGTLSLDFQSNQGLGTGPITLNPNGTLGLNRINASNALVFNGGTIAAYNGFGNSFSGPVTLNSTSTITGPDTLILSGAISGIGGFNKTGNNTLILSGNNTTTGANSIWAGTLQCDSSAALGSGAINITNGAKVGLNFTGTRVISALSYNGGLPLAAGTYGSSSSPATNQNNTYFTGNGTITILPVSATSLNLSTGSNPSLLGSTLSFTATVTGTAPTGNVAFYDGVVLLGTDSLNGSFQASFTTSNLAVGSHHITAKYVGNSSHAASASAVLDIGINSSVPAIPSQLNATSLVGWVGLTWSASNGATNYEVKRSLTSGGPYTTVAIVSGTNYTDTAIVNGMTYKYVVSSVTGTGSSVNSNEVSATPIIPISAKDILTFVFPSLPTPVISGTNISLIVASGTDLTTLAPTYTLSPWALGSPASGSSRNFTFPQTYIITASDNSTQNYTVTVTVAPPPLTYNFNDATLQGWNNRVWNGSAWIDLAANATTYAGTLLPASGNNGLFIPSNSAVWVSGNADYHFNTLWLRSPQFYLNGTGDLSMHLSKGIAKTTAPANDLAVPFAAIDGGGWKGVALRRVSDGVFVLNKPRSGSPGDSFSPVTFTQVELATLNFDTPYTLELINSGSGSWGWLTMDNVSIPGGPAPVNVAPVASPKNVTTAEDNAKSISLAATDADGNPLTYSVVTQPSNGMLSGTAPNVTYTPAVNYNGSDSFTFKVNDGITDSQVALVTITMTAVNDAPIASAQNFSTAEDMANVITLTATDVDLDSLTYMIATLPANGMLSGTPPNVTYTPVANYSGVDSFTFKANDGDADSASATVTITVSAVNDAPVASAQSISTTEGVATAITLSGIDVEAGALTYAIVTPPMSGTLSGSVPNVIYTPMDSFHGTDSFSFRVNDGNLESPVETVSITVTSASFTWSSGVVGNWSDGTKWTSGSSPNSGGLTNYIINFNTLGTYVSNNNLNAGFLLNRINFGGSTATLTGNRLALVASGSILPQLNQNSANAATVSANLVLNADTALSGSGGGALTLSGIISGGSSLTKTTTGNLTLSGLNTYSGGTTVSSGTLTLANQSGLGMGPLTFAAGTIFQQSNFEGNTSAGAVPNAINLNGNVTMNMPFNWKDIWLSQPVSGIGGFSIQGGNRSLTLTANNTFSGGVTLKNYDNRIQISHLNALGTGTFRTERTTAGSEGKLISLTNLSTGLGVANAIDIASDAYFNVLADGTNHLLLSGPITSAVGSGHLYKTGSAKLTLSGLNTYTGGTTVAGGMLDCNYAASLGNGIVSIASGGKLGLNFTGTRQIAALSLAGVVQANGSYGSTASPATNKNDIYFSGFGTVTVGPLNTAPLASSQSLSMAEDLPLSIDLLASDVDGNSLTYMLIDPPTSGTLSGTAPNLIYRPAANFHGVDSFTFIANDGTIDSNLATFTIMVTPVNDAPAAFAQSTITAEDTAKLLTLTASDVDSGSVTYTIVTQPASGTLNGIAPDLTYMPSANFSGTDSFIFKANDGSLDSASATVTITVTAVNDAPVASIQNVATIEDAAKAITLIAADIEGDLLTYSIVSPPAHGAISGTAPNLTYTPAVNYSGADSFTFKTNDGLLDSAAASVTITLSPVNDAPLFSVSPIVITNGYEGSAYTGQTLNGRATDPDAGDTITYSKISGPAWLSIESNGAISGTPALGSTGLNSFIVRATDSYSVTSDTTLQITVVALPLPWLTSNLGTGMLGGSATHNAGTFTQVGSGSFGGTSDKYRFTYQTLSGDGEIIAKISILQNTGTASRVGVMIRDTLATNSAQIFMGMSGINTYRWVRRTTTGGSNATTNSSTGIVPNTWVRLVRSGNTITAYKGNNGTTWTTVGSSTVSMASNCYIGLAVTSGTATTLNTSQFSNLSVTP